MKLLQALVFYFTISSISACGGGSSGTNDSTDNIPPTQTPTTSTPKILVPKYSGIETSLVFSEQDLGATAINLLEVLDLINYMVYDESANSSLFLQVNDSPAYASENLICNTGTSQKVSNANNTQIDITYNNCVIDGDTLNGTTVGFIDKSGATERVVVNIDLVISNATTNETFTLTGNITELSLQVFKVNLIIEQENQQIWIANMLLVPQQLDLLISFAGDIYISDLGKVNVETISAAYNPERATVTSNIAMSGDITLNIEINKNQSLSINYDGLNTPISISLVNFTGLPDSNIAPEANSTLLSENGVQYNEEISVTALGSTDSNLQALTYTWEVISKPSGASAGIQVNGVQASISGNRPGEYLIRLLVTDPLGLTDSLEFNLNYSKRPPTGEFSFAQAKYTFGDTMTGLLQLSSPDFDGPFEYSLDYAPDGLMITEQGSLTGQINLPNLGQPLSVNTGIRVTNSEHSTVFAATAIVSPAKSVQTLPVKHSLARQSKFAKQANEALFIENSLVQKLVRDSTTVKVAAHELPVALAENSMGILAIADIEETGSSQYLLAEYSEQNSKYLVYSINASGQRKDIYEFDDPQISSFILEIVVADIANNPGPELIIRSANNAAFMHVVSNQGELLSNIANAGTPWCDINDDGFTDWLSYNGSLEYSLFNETSLTGISLDINYVLAESTFIGAGSSCDLFVTRTSNLGLGETIIKIDPLSKEEVVIASIDELTTSSLQTSINALILMNVDTDTELELLAEIIVGESLQYSVIDNIYSGEPVINDADPNGNATNIPISGTLSFVVDIDNDNIHEIVIQSREGFASNRQLTVFDFTNKQLQITRDEVNRLEFDDPFNFIAKWQSDAAQVGIRQDTRVSFTPMNNQIVNIAAQEMDYRSLLAKEQGAEFIYSIEPSGQNDGSFVLQKKAIGAGIEWSLAIPPIGSSGGLFPLSMINESTILLQARESMIINRLTGEVLYTFENASQIVLRNDFSPFIGQIDESRLVLVGNGVDVKAVKISPTGSTELLTLPYLEGIINNREIRAELVQLDSQPDFEAVLFFEQDFIPKAFQLDVNASALKELPASLYGSLDEFYAFQSRSDCRVDSHQACRNLIFTQGLDEFIDYQHVGGSDIVSGQVVWRTTRPFEKMQDIEIINNSGVYKTLMLHESGIRVME